MTLQFPLRDRGTARWPGRIRLRGDVGPGSVFLGCELFSGLAPSQYRQVDRLFTVVDVRAGTVLGQQGSVCREFVVVLKGEIAVLRDDAPIAVLPPASHFGAAPLIHRDRPFRLVSLHALGPIRLAVASALEFDALVRTVPRIGQRITAVADRRQAYFDGMDAALDAQAENDSNHPFPVFDTPA